MDIAEQRLKKSVIAMSLASILCVGTSSTANAVSFNWGDIEGTFDSTWTVGASWRTESADEALIGKVNQGFDWTGYSAFSNTKFTSSQIWSQAGSFSSNGDLANQLYSAGNTTSEIVKGLHELLLKYDNYGLFLRGMYFYDNKKDAGHFGYQDPLTNKKYNPCENNRASEVICKDIRLLDAFVFADFDLNQGENPLNIRLGNQVISWGESTLIPHGIGVINPVDLNILNAPGAELKEAFLPQGMLSFSLGITENTSLSGFYQYEWKPIWVPPPGSQFATNDFAGFGGYQQNAQLGFNANPDINLDFLITEYQALAQMLASGVIAGAATINAALAYPTKVTLIEDPVYASDSGQYGFKYSYYASELNETEFAVYFMNYHSRRPLISGTTADFNVATLSAEMGQVAASGGQIDRDFLLGLSSFSKAQISYPEDIKLYGFSFNTFYGDTSIAGEIAHRQDEPLQIDDVELLFAAMPQQLANNAASLGPAFAAYDGISQFNQYFNPGNPLQGGEFAKGYILRDTTQTQFTFTHLFGPTLWADNLTVLGEIGGVYIHDMPDTDELRLNGPGTARSGGDLPILQVLHNGPETNPFPTDFAWGYRLLAKADFYNIYAATNLSTRIVFSHDVKGITPDPMFLFTEGKQSLGVGLNFDYQNQWQAGFSYNTFFGGVGTTNLMADRDFVSFNVKYSI